MRMIEAGGCRLNPLMVEGIELKKVKRGWGWFSYGEWVLIYNMQSGMEVELSLFNPTSMIQAEEAWKTRVAAWEQEINFMGFERLQKILTEEILR